MSVTDELKNLAGEASAEQKLKDLRRLLLNPTVTVQSIASLLKQIDAEIADRLPENIQELDQLADWLAAAGCDLEEILNSLTVESVETPAPQQH